MTAIPIPLLLEFKKGYLFSFYATYNSKFLWTEYVRWEFNIVFSYQIYEYYYLITIFYEIHSTSCLTYDTSFDNLNKRDVMDENMPWLVWLC